MQYLQVLYQYLAEFLRWQHCQLQFILSTRHILFSVLLFHVHSTLICIKYKHCSPRDRSPSLIFYLDSWWPLIKDENLRSNLSIWLLSRLNFDINGFGLQIFSTLAQMGHYWIGLTGPSTKNQSEKSPTGILKYIKKTWKTSNEMFFFFQKKDKKINPA